MKQRFYGVEIFTDLPLAFILAQNLLLNLTFTNMDGIPLEYQDVYIHSPHCTELLDVAHEIFYNWRNP
jgi:hypothetical protein